VVVSEVKFAALLHSMRVARGITQDALAKAARMSRMDVSRMERGIGRKPTDDEVQRLMSALGTPSSARRRET
jgi:transcriptional regulator with XRE-family HTH domain